MTSPSPDATGVPPRGRAGLRLGSVVGVPVFVAPSWFLFAAFVVFAYGPVLADRLDLTQGRAYTAAGSFAVLLLISVLLHEVGHCVVARTFGLPVRSITVTFLAGLTEITEPPQTPAREYAVAIAGPMVSLLLAGLGLATAPLLPDDSISQLVVQVLAVTNGIVAAFNLLPGLPLDGGRVLRAGVWKLTGNADLSTRAAAWAGRVVALAVVPAIMLLLLPSFTGSDPTLGTLLITALVAGFIYLGATASLQRARVLGRLPQRTVGNLARPALRVAAELPLAEAVRRAQEAGVHGLVVVDSADEPTAVVSEAAVKATPEHRRPWVSVDSVARRLEPGMVLDEGLGGEALLAALRETPASEYVVPGPGRGELRVLAATDVVKAAQG